MSQSLQSYQHLTKLLHCIIIFVLCHINVDVSKKGIQVKYTSPHPYIFKNSNAFSSL